MKTFNLKSITILGYFMLIMTLFFAISCESQNKKSDSKKDITTSSKQVVEAPSVDIHTAAFFGNLDAIKQHINAGSDLNKKDPYGSTPLVIAATFGKTDVAKALISGGADLHIKNNDGSTPLHIAAFFCRTEIVKALIANGVDKSILNNYGSTAYATVSGDFKDAKPIYDQISKDLGPLGLKLDYTHLEKTRPIITALLK